MFTDRKIINYQERTFDFTISITFVLLIVTLFGFSQKAPEYLSIIDYYLKIYICLFLIWRFNPFRSNIKFTDLDAKISFNAGLLILASTALNQYVKFFETDIVSKIKKMFYDVF
jgi:cytochrome c biogenesis protein CcdA